MITGLCIAGLVLFDTYLVNPCQIVVLESTWGNSCRVYMTSDVKFSTNASCDELKAKIKIAEDEYIQRLDKQ